MQAEICVQENEGPQQKKQGMPNNMPVPEKLNYPWEQDCNSSSRHILCNHLTHSTIGTKKHNFADGHTTELEYLEVSLRHKSSAHIM